MGTREILAKESPIGQLALELGEDRGGGGGGSEGRARRAVARANAKTRRRSRPWLMNSSSPWIDPDLDLDGREGMRDEGLSEMEKEKRFYCSLLSISFSENDIESLDRFVFGLMDQKLIFLLLELDWATVRFSWPRKTPNNCFHPCLWMLY